MPTPPSPTRRPPRYRHYKPKDLGVVRINGHDHYLGKYNSPESWEKYNRLIVSWLATGEAPAPEQTRTDAGVSVNEVILAFLKAHATHYRHADGTPTGELANFNDSLRPLRKLYGTAPAKEFSPKKLKLVRQSMLKAGLARTTINQRVGRIRHVFKWAESEEMIPASVHHALMTVAGLKKGRSEARETEPVKPVPDAYMDAIEPHVTRQVWTMVELQRLAGMRPGEVVVMRTCDLDTSGRVWSYAPLRHKTEHHQKGRVVQVGPKGQAVLRPWLRTDLAAFLFQPKEAMSELRAEQRQNRKTPLTPSQRARRRKAKPKRAPGHRYTARSYAHAVQNACKKAGVPTWSPNRLRHNMGTLLRREFGIDTARAALGHSDVATTAIYAERDARLAAAAIEQVG